jgi:ribosome-associated translation inhibitor RaiA
MQVPVQVTFRHLDGSNRIRRYAEEKANALGRVFNRIMGCRVTIEPMGGRRGRAFQVRVDLDVPGQELVAQTSSNDRAANPEDLAMAVAGAFHVAKRELLEYVRRLKRGSNVAPSLR